MYTRETNKKHKITQYSNSIFIQIAFYTMSIVTDYYCLLDFVESMEGTDCITI